MFLRRGLLIFSLLFLLSQVSIAQAVPPPIPPPPPPGLPINQGQLFLMIVGVLYGVFLVRKTLKSEKSLINPERK